MDKDSYNFPKTIPEKLKDLDRLHNKKNYLFKDVPEKNYNEYDNNQEGNKMEHYRTQYDNKLDKNEDPKVIQTIGQTEHDNYMGGYIESLCKAIDNKEYFFKPNPCYTNDYDLENFVC